mgnify:CR=1 FL=1
MTKEEQEKLGELAMKITNEKSIEIFGATDPSLGNSDYRMGWERGCELGFRKGYYEALNIAGKNLVKADVIKSVCEERKSTPLSLGQRCFVYRQIRGW